MRAETREPQPGSCRLGHATVTPRSHTPCRPAQDDLRKEAIKAEADGNVAKSLAAACKAASMEAELVTGVRPATRQQKGRGRGNRARGGGYKAPGSGS